MSRYDYKLTMESAMKIKLLFLLLTCTFYYLAATDLIDAISQGDLDRAEKLIKDGIDLNEQDWDGNTALHALMKLGTNIVPWGGSVDKKRHMEFTKLLLEKGANPNAQNWCGGHTPLHIAPYVYRCIEFNKGKRSECHECIALLLEFVAYGADLSIKDVEGKTPYDYLYSEHGFAPKAQFITECLLVGGRSFISNITENWEQQLLHYIEDLKGSVVALLNDPKDVKGMNLHKALVLMAVLGEEERVTSLLLKDANPSCSTEGTGGKSAIDIIARIVRNPHLTQKEQVAYRRICCLLIDKVLENPNLEKVDSKKYMDLKVSIIRHTPENVIFFKTYWKLAQSQSGEKLGLIPKDVTYLIMDNYSL